VGVEALAVDAGPAAIGTDAGIGDEDVGVQLGVAGPAGVVAEGGAHHPAAGLEADPSAVDASPAHPAGVALQVVDRPLHRLLMGSEHGPGVVTVAERPQDRHRLGGGEGGVVAGPQHPAVPQVGAVGPAAGEEGTQVVVADGSRQAQRLGQVPEPAAGLLTAP